MTDLHLILPAPSVFFDMIGGYEHELEIERERLEHMLHGYDYIDTDEEEEILDSRCSAIRANMDQLRLKISTTHEYLRSINFEYPDREIDFDSSDDLGLSPEFYDSFA